MGDTDGAADEREVTLGDAMAIASEAMALGDLDQASKILEQIVAAKPDYLDGLNFLAAVRFYQRHFGEAIDILKQAERLSPDNSGLKNNMANAYLEMEDFENAVLLYREAIRLDNGNIEALSNLGYFNLMLEQYEDAEFLLKKALELDPNLSHVHRYLSEVFYKTERLDEAIKHGYEELATAPRDRVSPQLLFLVHMQKNDLKEARKVLDDWIAENPDDPEAHHLLASLEATSVPERAPDHYVEHVFDRFADSFDSKLARLSYRAPQLTGELVDELFDPSISGAMTILDAGCGTGLCGQYLRPHAKRLIGIDLSERMLAKAERRGGYDELEKAELTSYLEARTDEYDAIISADTLCYFGALEAFMKAAGQSMKRGAFLVFTLERAGTPPEAGYSLTKSGRYEHDPDYVKRLLKAEGFEVLAERDEVLRTESLDDVRGLLYAARLT